MYYDEAVEHILILTSSLRQQFFFIETAASCSVYKRMGFLNYTELLPEARFIRFHSGNLPHGKL